MNQVILALFEIGLGGWLAMHCPRAAWREYRHGIASGRGGEYARDGQPVRFWGTVFGTAFAGAFGFVFLLIGITSLALGPA